ncbi:uncharacterized protein IL334_000468 [Kwoniella shivajii]|uniref:Uncharacterized protein n=1 Tax=Kwoniella shivajii TaxID=564305 RepID=A0ABZ1CP96_9TREE|nr:hypothetical protein IL334_000468 [Kwoniella shivajii]
MPAVGYISNSASSSRISSPVPSGSGSATASTTMSTTTTTSNQPIDPYRTLSTHVKKSILPLIPSSSSSSSSTIPNLPSLLSLDPSTYSSRLSGKTLQTSLPSSSSSSSSLNQNTVSSGISPLVKGQKRNRGYPSELAKVQKQVEHAEIKRKELGLVGMRKVRRRLGGVIPRGMMIQYNSLIPLNRLHVTYLISLLSLPPLPFPNQNASFSRSTSTSTSTSTISSNLTPNTTSTAPTINSEIILSKLSKADFTGIYLSIKSSRNPSLIAHCGIVIEETCSTFRIVNKQNKVKVIPKDGTLFTLSIPAYSPNTTTKGATNPTDAPDTGRGEDGVDEDEDEDEERGLESFLSKCPKYEISLLGSSFTNRSGDRAGKKFRPSQGHGGGSGWAQDWVNTDWQDTFSRLSDMLCENKEQETPVKGRKKHGANGRNRQGKRKRNKSRRKDPPAFGNP